MKNWAGHIGFVILLLLASVDASRGEEGRAAAQSFYRYLSSPAAAKVFEKYGFTVLSKIKVAPEGTE